MVCDPQDEAVTDLAELKSVVTLFAESRRPAQWIRETKIVLAENDQKDLLEPILKMQLFLLLFRVM
jgi:hypothetical protein